MPDYRNLGSRCPASHWYWSLKLSVRSFWSSDQRAVAPMSLEANNFSLRLLGGRKKFIHSAQFDPTIE
jgi:hypothetical protein